MAFYNSLWNKSNFFLSFQVMQVKVSQNYECQSALGLINKQAYTKWPCTYTILLNRTRPIYSEVLNSDYVKKGGNIFLGSWLNASFLELE